jgi:hypothetical protein
VLHDHAVLPSINVFKDKLSRASLWGIEDARRIVEAEGFDLDRFVDLARRSSVASIVWIVADWMVRKKASEPWKQIRDKLGRDGPPRPLYAWAFRELAERAPTALPTRLLARVGSDDPRMWAGALRQAAALTWRSSRGK